MTVQFYDTRKFNALTKMLLDAARLGYEDAAGGHDRRGSGKVLKRLKLGEHHNCHRIAIAAAYNGGYANGEHDAREADDD